MQLGQIGQCSGLVRAVVDHDQLAVWVVGEPVQRGDALAQQAQLVAGGDQDADFGQHGGQRPMHPVAARAGAADLCRRAAALQVLKHRAPAGFLGVGLGLGPAGGAAFDHSPVVQHMRDVNDLIGPQVLSAAQHQVMVLRALEARTQAAQLAQQRGFEGGQMAHHVLGQAQVRVPVGLEVGVLAGADGGERAAGRRPQLVFVRINQPGVSKRARRLGHQQQRVLGQQVVVAQQRHPGALRQVQAGVGGGTDVAVLRTLHHADAGIAGLKLVQVAV